MASRAVAAALMWSVSCGPRVRLPALSAAVLPPACWACPSLEQPCPGPAPRSAFLGLFGLSWLGVSVLGLVPPASAPHLPIEAFAFPCQAA